LEQDKKLKKALALIIACTRRIKRPKDIVTLAKSISYAEKHMGDLEAVAKAMGLSVRQLKDFQTVEDLCADVRSLVAKRAVDSVDVVKTISKLPPEKQKTLATYFADGKITSKEVRIITSFARNFPDRPIKKVITDYNKSKDIRVYVAEFRLPVRFNNRVGLRKQFEEIVGRKEITNWRIRDRVVILEMTELGHKNLRKAVRKQRTTLRKFVISVVEKLAD